MKGLIKALAFAGELVDQVVKPGETVVDATAGNGHDTLFLARKVGPRGRVFAFDIQEKALTKVRQKLAEEGLLDRVTLFCAGHETMADHVPHPVAAVMFNLGYLPGGDHGIITRPATTLAALEAALRLLRRGGLVTLVVYTGHAGGKEEGETIISYCTQLPQAEYQVLQYRFLNQRNSPPYLLAVAKV